MNNSEQEILERAINTFGVNSQVDMAIEEMAELTKALLKYRRCCNGDAYVDDKDKLFGNVIEEMADVQIMLNQLYIMFGEPVNYPKDKIERLKERLDKIGKSGENK